MNTRPFPFLSLLAALILASPVPVWAQAVATPEKTVTATAPNKVRDKVFDAETFILDNGLRVVVIPNPRAPVITHMVWYGVGAADETQGKTGLAHFLEHLMFKGSEHVPPGEFSKRVRAMGGTDNAFTTQDYTAYFQNIAAAHLRDVMTMEADRMRGMTLPPAEFESEQQVVLEERRQNTENDPQSWFMEQLRYALFPGHPYATPVIGWKHDVDALTRDDALAFHKLWYAPNNAILVVGGDITAATLKPLATEIYGSIPANPVPKIVFPDPAPFPGEARYVLRDERIKQPMVVWMARAPGSVINKADSLALEVLMEIMSGSPATRLYKSLVVEQKIATSASMGYHGQTRDLGTISAGLVPADNTTPEQLEKAFLREVDQVSALGVTEAELNDAKTRMKDSAAFARDSLSGPARTIGQALITGSTLDDVEYWPYDIDAVTAAQVQDVAKRYLTDNTARISGIILPAEMPATPAPEKKP